MTRDDRRPVRRSVEVEYWVIDDRGRLTEPGDLVDATAGAEREFVEPLLEIKTEPCPDAGALERQFTERLQRVLAAADERGKQLVPLGTPLGDERIAERPDERTRIQNEVVGEPFRHVRHCAGTHVHVEQLPGRVVEQVNLLIALDPALALVNSSPYYRGRRLATGARSKLYRRLAYADMPHQGRLWPYLADTDQWDRRLERRYEAFVTAALRAGVDRVALESNFDPESAVWTPVQIRDTFGTVEWRSPDNALPSRIVRLANHLASLVERLRDAPVRVGGTGEIRDAEIRLPDFETVLQYLEAAFEDGLEAEPVRAYLGRMGFDVSAYDPISRKIDGYESLEAAEVRDYRLEYAAALRQDLKRVAVPADD